MKTSETISKISAALVMAQSSMGNASKESKNPFFKSSYADLNSIREAVMPALHSNGISILQPTVVENGKAYVETVLLHASGEYISSLTEIIVGKQNDAQAAGSGISYARRYGLQSLICVGAEDDDGEKSLGRRDIPKPKPAMPTQASITAAPDPLAPGGVFTQSPVSRFEAHKANKFPTDLTKMTRNELQIAVDRSYQDAKNPKHVISAEEKTFVNNARAMIAAIDAKASVGKLL